MQLCDACISSQYNCEGTFPLIMIQFILDVFKENKQDDAIIWRDQTYAYEWLYDRVLEWRSELVKQSVASGSVVILEGDFSPNAVALFIVLIEHSCILVPLTKSIESKKAEFTHIAEGEMRIAIADDDSVLVDRLPHRADHELYSVL